MNVALPGIQAGLNASLSGLQWVIDAYALTLAAFLLTAGSLADMYGRRPMYLIGLVIFTGPLAAIRRKDFPSTDPQRSQGDGACARNLLE